MKERSPEIYACPHCRQTVQAVAEPHAVACPHCGLEIIIPAVEDSIDLATATALSSEAPVSESPESEIPVGESRGDISPMPTSRGEISPDEQPEATSQDGISHAGLSPDALSPESRPAVEDSPEEALARLHMQPADVPSEPAEEPEGELDADRIAALSRQRRSAHRAMSYCLIALVVCVVGAIQAGIDMYHQFRAGGSTSRAIAFGLLTAVAAWGAAFFAARAEQMRGESRDRKIPAHSPVPDFSTLSDGSHFASNLESMGQNVDHTSGGEE
jgi:DNA-directed RNA polymerase subunit RPC12/RpoP